MYQIVQTNFFLYLFFLLMSMLSLWWNNYIFEKNCVVSCNSGFEIATDTVANATKHFFSLATKNSGSVATLAESGFSMN